MSSDSTTTTSSGPEYCIICGSEVRIQIFKSTGICSEDCRKDRDDDHLPHGMKIKM